MNGTSKQVKGLPEARWFRLCSDSHAKFCPCNNWRSHLKRPCQDTGTDAGTPGGEADDAELAAILDATEEVEEAITVAVAEAE